MLIIKASGEKVQFNRRKYVNTLKRIGLSVGEASEIANNIYQDLYPEISTDQIYQKTHQALKRKDKVLAAKYSLKRAIMQLGPGGFYFERYMAAVLEAYGYQTKYNQFIYGKCTEHEVDIIATRQKKKYMIECKFHTNPGRKSDIKVALYVYARFLDLKDLHKFVEPVLITNTRFTSEAIKYSKCMGVKVMGWHYPPGSESLEYYIESKKLYPVTVLTSLNSHLNKRFREVNIVLASDLLKFTARSLAKRFRVKEGLAERLMTESRLLTS